MRKMRKSKRPPINAKVMRLKIREKLQEKDWKVATLQNYKRNGEDVFTRAYIFDFMSGLKQSMSVEAYANVAEALGCSVEWLMADDGRAAAEEVAARLPPPRPDGRFVSIEKAKRMLGWLDGVSIRTGEATLLQPADGSQTTMSALVLDPALRSEGPYIKASMTFSPLYLLVKMAVREDGTKVACVLDAEEPV